MNETERWEDERRAGSGGGAQDVRRQAEETAAALAGEAKAAASSVGGAVSAQASRGKDQVAGRMATVAERLKDSADNLRGDEAWLAEMVDRGASRLGQLADELRSRDLRGIVHQIEAFGRREPAMLAGAAVAVGFALTRFARASSERHAQPQRQADPATQVTP